MTTRATRSTEGSVSCFTQEAAAATLGSMPQKTPARASIRNRTQGRKGERRGWGGGGGGGGGASYRAITQHPSYDRQRGGYGCRWPTYYAASPCPRVPCRICLHIKGEKKECHAQIQFVKHCEQHSCHVLYQRMYAGSEAWLLLSADYKRSRMYTAVYACARTCTAVHHLPCHS